MLQFDAQKAIKAVQRYKIISFDIFDTLIKRNVPNPACIFDITEKKHNAKYPEDMIEGFKGARISAEKKAREGKPGAEVTLDEIYEKIDASSNPALLNASERLKKIEIDTEIEYCMPNIPILKVYKKSIAMGKDVIIVSDMYLPQNIIEKMLQKCGIAGYRKLYLSSDVGVQKMTGKLYDFVIADLKIKASDIIHFGDRKKADNLIPRMKGMGSFYVDPVMLQTNFLTKKDLREAGSPLFSFINNGIMEIKERNKVFQWGYEAFGPLLLGFTTWVHGEVEKRKIERAYFLARDMNLVIQIYRKMYGHGGTSYLEVSRAALRRAYVVKKNNMNSVFDTMGRGNYSIRELLFALKLDDIEGICKRAGVFSEERVALGTDISWHYPALNACVLKILKEQEDHAGDFLESQGLYEDGKCALIDIGWHGTTQNMLETIVGRKFEGLYFGSTKRDNYPEMRMSGYWFSLDEGQALPFISMMKILEIMLFNDIGTVTGYYKDGEAILPVYGDREMEDYSLVKEFQSGALKFIDDYTEFSGEALDVIPENEAVKAYREFAFSPTADQARTFKELNYEDGKLYYLAHARPLHEYLMHPKLLLKDYKDAQWKEGFIKQILPFAKNPYGIDMAIKRVLHARKV